MSPNLKNRVSGWLSTYKVIPSEENISGIENNTISYFFSGSTSPLLFEKPKKKLSLLRGKMTRQSEKDIDDLILALRNEWDRNI